MDLEHTRRFKAKMGILPEMLEFIGAVCRDAGLEHPLRRRVELQGRKRRRLNTLRRRGHQAGAAQQRGRDRQGRDQ